MEQKRDNVAVLIDGFNFYHAICTHMKSIEYPRSLKWLDYDSLVRNVILKNVNYDKLIINFYTALNSFKHDNQGKNHSSIINHQIYTQALKYKNIKVIEGKFKIRDENLNTYVVCKNCSHNQFIHKFNIDLPNRIFCSHCNNEILPSDIDCIKKVEEKKTDVKIAIDLVNIARDNIYNKIYLFSTDSDFIPAVEYIKDYCKNVQIIIVAPSDKIVIKKFNNKTNKLEINSVPRYGTSEFNNLGVFVYRLKLSKLVNHLFDDEIILENSTKITNPWKD